MTPKPATPHAGEILGNHWEDSLTPELLAERSVQLATVAADLQIKSVDGQVAATNLLGYGQGVQPWEVFGLSNHGRRLEPTGMGCPGGA